MFMFDWFLYMLVCIFSPSNNKKSSGPSENWMIFRSNHQHDDPIFHDNSGPDW